MGSKWDRGVDGRLFDIMFRFLAAFDLFSRMVGEVDGFGGGIPWKWRGTRNKGVTGDGGLGRLVL